MRVLIGRFLMETSLGNRAHDKYPAFHLSHRLNYKLEWRFLEMMMNPYSHPYRSYPYPQPTYQYTYPYPDTYYGTYPPGYWHMGGQHAGVYAGGQGTGYHVGGYLG